MSKIIDLSINIETDMPTCGTAWHQSVMIEPMGTIDSVGRNTSRIILGSHSGTHMDAPGHFIYGGDGIDKMDLNLLCGDIGLIDLRHKHSGAVVTIEDLKGKTIEDKMLFIFGWYHYWKTEQYYKKFPYFSEEAIDYLISNGMKLMALDTPSPDTGDAIKASGGGALDSPNHKKMLDQGIVIIEYLCNTDAIDLNKTYEIIALPLKIVGIDGSPSRVILREVM